MAAAAILGTLCIALAALLLMVVGAVLGYFLWNCAFWWLDSTSGAAQGRDDDEPGHRRDAGRAPPQSEELGLERFPSRFGWPGPGFAQPAGAAGIFGHDGMRGCSVSLMDDGRDSDWPRPRPCVRPSVVTIEESPAQGRGRDSPVVIRSQPVAQKPQGGGSSSASAGQDPKGHDSKGQDVQPVQFEDVLRGYASYLALKFAGTLSFHHENVSAAAHAYQLKEVDICYCFLCMEEVANSESGAALSLGRWTTGQYAARVWVVALARFVAAAQRRAGAQQAERLQTLCEEWGYVQESFLKEVQQCEVPFQRKHGQALLSAFSQERIRFQEVQRAARTLSEQGVAAAPKPSRLQQALPPPGAGPAALPGAPASSSLSALPALASEAAQGGEAAPSAALVPSRVADGARKRTVPDAHARADSPVAEGRGVKQRKRGK